MSLTSQIKKILKKNDVKFIDAFKDVENESDLLEIFSKTIPERVLHYDSECIDSPESYIGVLEEHAEITLGEFQPKNSKVTGDLDSSINLSFNIDGKLKKFRIEQNSSSWMTESFYDRLRSFSKRELGSDYLELPTTDQSTAVVYLPKKVASQLERKCIGMKTTDQVIEYIKNRGCPSTINWNYTSQDVVDGLSSDGETIATAILKAELPEHIGFYSSGYTFVEGVFEEFGESTPVSLISQNKYGETPYDISRNHSSNFIQQYLDYVCQSETISLGEVLSPNLSCFELNDFIKDAISNIHPLLESMNFDKSAYGNCLSFSPEKNFIRGKNQATLLLNRNREGKLTSFKLFIQQSGDIKRTLCKNYQLDEVKSVSNMLSQYCTGDLWNKVV